MVATSAMEKEISTEMTGVGISLSEKILSKCVALAQNHKIDALELARTWEAHSLNKNVLELNEGTFPSFSTTVLAQVKSSAKKNTITPKSEKKAVVGRLAMSKRSAPSTSGDGSVDPSFVSPSKKRSVLSSNPDFQLDQIANSSVKTESPSSSNNSTTVTPPKPKASPSVAYENRTNAGASVFTYNPNNIPETSSNDESMNSDSNTNTGRICKIRQTYQNVHISSPYHYMTDAARHTHLEARLASMTEQMIKAYDIPLPGSDDGEENQNEKEGEQKQEHAQNGAFATFEHVGVPRQSLQTNIGRICNEAHVGKLNKTTLLLEGSKNGSNGARIELDVEKLSEEASFSLFQGQIVCVEGYNYSGRKMVVHRLMEGLPSTSSSSNSSCDKGDDAVLVQPKTRKQDLLEMQYGNKEGCQNGNSLKIYAVAGPYTTSDDLEYQPLADLLGTIEVDKPDVVILMGPFVDMRQQKVKTGEELTLEYQDGSKRYVTFEQFFAAKIANELEVMFENDPALKTQFVLVPSMDDAIAEPVYPQPPLENQLEKVISMFSETEDMPYGSLCLKNIETAGDTKISKDPMNRRIHLVSNPSTIQINDVTIGFTSLDAYIHMSTESINNNLPPRSRLTRLAEHFVKQRSFYPIFPPASGNGKDFNLEITKSSAFSMPVQPDVLILPSRLTCTAMDISNGTTLINPGHLVKGSNGGSFAIMDIHPMKKRQLENKSESDSAEEIGHYVRDRIRVEIRRI